ncbi:MAG: hypothetical protein HKN32_03720, partial [Flavobacteriales bacterium]|nr:hypothetical protein [Flavobacteriales bacterium]
MTKLPVIKSYLSCSLVVMLLVSAGSPKFADAQQVSLDPSKELSQYMHDEWQVDDGLPQNSVRALAQTQDGYLWLGTDDGLV